MSDGAAPHLRLLDVVALPRRGNLSILAPPLDSWKSGKASFA